MSVYRLNKRSNIQLCYPFEEKRLLKWTPPWIIQPKLDGFRARAVKEKEGFVLYSSECNEIYSAPHILNCLDRCLKHKRLGYELDGELYVHGWDFNSIESVVSRTKNFHPDAPMMEFHVFDLIDGEPQWSRLQNLALLFEFGIGYEECVKLVPNTTAESLDEIMMYLKDFTNVGYEGFVLRHIDALYRRKRSIYVMKFKPRESDVYRIVGYKQMKDKDGYPKEMLGSFECISDENGETFTVGSGLTDDFRIKAWKNPEAFFGKLLVVHYQNLTKGRRVPRNPVICGPVEVF